MSKTNTVSKASTHGRFISHLFVTLFLLPSLSWSAQPTVRIAQAVDALAFLPIYVSRANGYFNDEGVNLELIIVQGGGPDLQALIAGSVDFDATSTGSLLRAFGGGIELLGIHNVVGKCIIDLIIRKESAQPWASPHPCPFRKN